MFSLVLSPISPLLAKTGSIAPDPDVLAIVKKEATETQAVFGHRGLSMAMVTIELLLITGAVSV